MDWKRPEDCLFRRDTRDDLKDRSFPEGSFLPFDFLSGRAGMVSDETLANPAILLQVFVDMNSSLGRYAECFSAWLFLSSCVRFFLMSTLRQTQFSHDISFHLFRSCVFCFANFVSRLVGVCRVVKQSFLSHLYDGTIPEQEFSRLFYILLHIIRRNRLGDDFLTLQVR